MRFSASRFQGLFELLMTRSWQSSKCFRLKGFLFSLLTFPLDGMWKKDQLPLRLSPRNTSSAWHSPKKVFATFLGIITSEAVFSQKNSSKNATGLSLNTQKPRTSSFSNNLGLLGTNRQRSHLKPWGVWPSPPVYLSNSTSFNSLLRLTHNQLQNRQGILKTLFASS